MVHIGGQVGIGNPGGRICLLHEARTRPLTHNALQTVEPPCQAAIQRELVKLVGLSLGFTGFLAVLAMAADVDNSLFGVVAKITGKPFRVTVALRAFEPNVEEVCEFGVLHIVCVGGINDNGGDALVGDGGETDEADAGFRTGHGAALAFRAFDRTGLVVGRAIGGLENGLALLDGFQNGLFDHGSIGDEAQAGRGQETLVQIAETVNVRADRGWGSFRREWS